MKNLLQYMVCLGLGIAVICHLCGVAYQAGYMARDADFYERFEGR